MLYRYSGYIFSIPYTAIQTAVSQRRLFHLAYADIDGREASLQIKLESTQAASGVYRAITEKHAFYSCETVRSAVTTQFIRDLKVPLICRLQFKRIPNLYLLIFAGYALL
jgi:E3 ubiquitin-protein ligase MYLIP